MKHRSLLMLVLVVALVAAGLTTACGGGVTYWVSSTNADPHKNLTHDWSPGIALPGGEGKVNSCYIRSSTVSGRAHMCRIVEGYDEISGQGGNWDFHMTCAYFTPGCGNDGAHGLWAVAGDCNNAWGCAIDVTGAAVGRQGLVTFEGCNYYTTDDGGSTFWCDYMSYGNRVPAGSPSKPVNTWTWSYFLAGFAATADHYVWSAGACAAGAVAIWAGQAAVSAFFLHDCADTFSG